MYSSINAKSKAERVQEGGVIIRSLFAEKAIAA